MTRHYAVALAVSLFASGGALAGDAAAQQAVRANDTDQRNLELTVARYLMTGRTPIDIAPDHPMYAFWGKMTIHPVGPPPGRAPWRERTFVLEPRVRVSGIVRTAGGPARVTIDPAIVPSHELATAHDSAHMATLAGILGLTGVLDDAKACPDFTAATRCRYQDFTGYVQMGSAWLRGNSAEMIVRWGEHSSNPNSVYAPGLYYGGVWTCSLERTATWWRVVRCSRMQL